MAGLFVYKYQNTQIMLGDQKRIVAQINEFEKSYLSKELKLISIMYSICINKLVLF